MTLFLSSKKSKANLWHKPTMKSKENDSVQTSVSSSIISWCPKHLSYRVTARNKLNKEKKGRIHNVLGLACG